jgi:16S rRNA (uracil1498-N3)-methyltransferase
MRQFYLAPEQWPEPPEPGETILLADEESRHLLKVLRARPGDNVRLTDGCGRIVLATLVESSDRKKAKVTVDSVTIDTHELARPRLVLACGLIKGKRWESLLETAVEHGVHRIVPLQTHRSEVDPGGGRRRRWEAAVLSALKQSGRSWRPVIDEPVTLAGFLDSLDKASIFYGRARDRDRGPFDEELLTPSQAATPGADLQDCEHLVWCVGPEGGWESDEVLRLGKRGQAVRLGGQRLRTGTAAAAGLLLLSSRREQWLASLMDAGPGSSEPA